MGLFGKSKTPDPKEQVNEWCRKIRKENNGLQRQINQIQRGEQNAIRSIKLAAKKGDNDSAKILAKEVVHARKSVAKIYTAKANLSSVEMQIKQQAAQLRVVGSLQKSTEVMKNMQQLVKLPEIQKTMMEMSKEMMKAGIIEEMMDDAMENLEDQDELEEDVQNEVDKILSELTLDVGSKIAKAPSAPEASLQLPEPEEELEDAEGEVKDELEQMENRLQALRS